MKTTILLFTVLSFTFYSCKKSYETKLENDGVIFAKINSPTGFQYYHNDSNKLESIVKNGHATNYFKVRYNKIANDAMIDNGKLPYGKIFPIGSIVVRESYDSLNGSLNSYSVLYKNQNGLGAKFWLWAEYKPKGEIIYSAANEGSKCVECHKIDDRDFNRTFELY